MSSILVSKAGGDWIPIQPGRVHANTNGNSYASRGHHNYYTNKDIDSKLIGVDCICWGHVTLYDIGPGGHIAFTFRTAGGWASQVDTFGATREWNGGAGGMTGGLRRTAHLPFQLLARPTASTVSIQFRFDMDSTGNASNWSLGNLQSNLFICPVWTP